MDEYRGVMIYAEIFEGRLGKITKELLGCGRKLAEALQESLYAVVLSNDIGSSANELIAFGAEKVYAVEHPFLKEYQSDSYVLSVTEVLKDARPRVFIMGQTSLGQDLMPRLAFALGTETFLDCIDLSIDSDSKQLLRTKPVYGGKALATYTSKSHPQMATVRFKSMSPAEKDSSSVGEIIRIEPQMTEAQIRTKLHQRILDEEKGGIKLEDAEVVIAGGRGIGSAEGFKQVHDLASLLTEAAVGASRAPVDLAWVPSSLQIGLTGKIVSPKVYIATGLSGSSQHMAGCSGAETIIAINTDPKANIFKESKFGIVGDWKVVLPALIRAIHNL